MWVIMGSQTPCQEKETSLTTSQYDHSFKCFNDKDASFILTNADFLCYTFPLPHLVMLCGYHYENEPRGADKKTTELAYLHHAAAREGHIIFLPSLLVSLLLVPEPHMCPMHPSLPLPQLALNLSSPEMI